MTVTSASGARADYLGVLHGLLDTMLSEESDALDRAAEVVAEAVRSGHQVLCFGTGHSHCLALEFCDRAGGLVAPKVLRDGPLSMHEGLAKSTATERLGDYGGMLVDLAGVTAGDVLIVISNSGRNAVPVEAAQHASRLGAATIAITSVAHSKASAIRPPATARLYEVADIVIDNHGQLGDAVLWLDGLDTAVGATSTVVGAAIMQALSISVATRLLETAHTPDVYVSANQDISSPSAQAQPVRNGRTP